MAMETFFTNQPRIQHSTLLVRVTYKKALLNLTPLDKNHNYLVGHNRPFATSRKETSECSWFLVRKVMNLRFYKVTEASVCTFNH